MTCKICSSSTSVITNKLVLNKYNVNYHQCDSCKFIQTDEPFWIEEAYQSAITSLDIGLISRNIYLKDIVSKIIENNFPSAKIMIDYGGGYGMFVRMMRDLGFNFYRQDVYCENLFATYFDVKDANVNRFDILTSFEVFEHLVNPIEEIKKMFELSDTIIFSTELIPTNKNDFSSWWYVTPLTGQHVAFYDKKTLAFIAEKFGKKLYTNGSNLHILISVNKEINPFAVPQKSIIEKIIQKLIGKTKTENTRESLLQVDYNFILKKLSK